MITASLSRSATDSPLGSWGTMRALLPYLWPADEWTIRARVVLALLLVVASKGFLVYVPILYGAAVDALDSTGDVAIVTLPVALIFGYGITRVLSLAFGELRDAVFARVAQRAVRIVALDVFDHLHQLSLRFHLGRQTGLLSRAIDRGTRAIETLLRFSLFNMVPTLVELTLAFGIIWWALNLVIATVTIFTVAIYVIYTLLVTEWRIQFRREMNKQEGHASTKAIDSLLNYETVKYFGNEAHEAARLDVALCGYQDAAIKNQVSLSLLNVGQATIISIGLTAVMALAGRGIINGTMTIGDFVVANTYLMQLYQPLNFFGFAYREIKQALIDIETMFDLLSERTEVADAANAETLALNQAEVRFESVFFRYDERLPILKDINITIPSGATVALVGASGSGKSTISRLLFRFYDVDQGRIMINDQDLRQVTQTSLRRAIGVVPQDTVLFNDSVFYNIAYGRPDATVGEVEQAARMAHIHDFIISTPDGYQTVVGERGLKLSGGEKQRVAIARMVLKNPAILILDEATSALDSETEQEIQHNLRVLSKGRTTLVIAHRLSTVVDADEIVVLHSGVVTERGHHRNLLAAGGMYAQMWKRQQDGDSG